jgi:hypothetical protein
MHAHITKIQAKTECVSVLTASDAAAVAAPAPAAQQSTHPAALRPAVVLIAVPERQPAAAGW